MARSIMIDLETLGDTPGCGIVSIGAVACLPDGFVVDRFYTVVSRTSCAHFGLHEAHSTLLWWEEQSPAARKVLDDAASASAPSLPDALAALNTFVSRAGDKAEIYGNGSDFDNAILAVAARQAGVQLAWRFWQNRCYRTLKARTPWVKLQRIGEHHNALNDAESQAKHLGAINEAMAITADQLHRGSQFIQWMADRYRQRTSRRFLGLRLPTISADDAHLLAASTFDATDIADRILGDPAMTWTREGANDLVDEDITYWGEG